MQVYNAPPEGISFLGAASNEIRNSSLEVVHIGQFIG